MNTDINFYSRSRLSDNDPEDPGCSLAHHSLIFLTIFHRYTFLPVIFCTAYYTKKICPL